MSSEVTFLPPRCTFPAITRSALEVGLYPLHCLLIVQVARRSRAVAGLAKVAVVLRRHVRRNQLPLTRSEAVRLMQQNMRELAHGLGRLRTKGESGADAGQVFTQWNVG